MLVFKLQREQYPNDCAVPVIDIIVKGEQKLRSASLKTFNNKINTLLSGHSVDDEVDDIQMADYAEMTVDSSDTQDIGEDEDD